LGVTTDTGSSSTDSADCIDAALAVKSIGGGNEFSVTSSGSEDIIGKDIVNVGIFNSIRRTTPSD
jgi:hypothetical protein